MQRCEIESALEPLNETLIHLVAYGGSKQSQEKDILQIMKLMACIRTRALKTGWDADCECDMEKIQSTLQRLKKMHE